MFLWVALFNLLFHVLTVYNHLEANKIIIKNVICLLVCINTGCIHLIYYPGCIINKIFFMINELLDEHGIIFQVIVHWEYIKK